MTHEPALVEAVARSLAGAGLSEQFKAASPTPPQESTPCSAS